MTLTALCDLNKKETTINTLTLATRSLYKVKSLPSCNYLPWQTVGQYWCPAKRPLLRHSQMPKDKNYVMSEAVEP